MPILPSDILSEQQIPIVFNGEQSSSGDSLRLLSLFSGAGPKQFPTYRTENGFEGNGVRLQTMYTGDFGKDMGKPIAAGNLFLGRFILDQAMMDPLKATEFGVQWDRDPLRITGYYKYKPGSKYTNAAMEVIPDCIDEASIYAVFYNNIDPDGNLYFLYGDDVADLDKIIDNPRGHALKCSSRAEMFQRKRWPTRTVTWQSYSRRAKAVHSSREPLAVHST